MISGWRIASLEYSNSVEEMMSGEGAYRFGGRWNSAGSRVVYLGSSLAQAAMELLVHLGRADILGGYRKLEVSFPEELIQHISPEDLPKDWKLPTMAPSVQAVGDQWVLDQSPLILQVPSAAVPGEFNYLFNPEHLDEGRAIYGDIEDFDYDSRLIK